MTVTIDDAELRAIHSEACAAVAKTDRTLSPADDGFWPLYISAALQARRNRSTPFTYAYLYNSMDSAVWRTGTNGAEINGVGPIDHRALFADPPIISRALQLLVDERESHIEKGWTPEHDDNLDAGVLASAASAYALVAADVLHPFSQGDGAFTETPPATWPFDLNFWRPTSPKRSLVKAATLLLAEIERMERNPDGGQNQQAGAN